MVQLLVQQYPQRQFAVKLESHHEELVYRYGSNSVMLRGSWHHKRERCRDPMPSEAFSRYRIYRHALSGRLLLEAWKRGGPFRRARVSSQTLNVARRPKHDGVLIGQPQRF